MKKLLLALLAVVCWLLESFSGDVARAQNFYTWDGMEPDKMASAWLLKRWVDTDATIQFINKKDRRPDGIAFDLPMARLRRYHGESTYESIVRTYGIEDDGVRCIGRIVHEIEINKWYKKQMDTQVRRFEEKIWQLIEAGQTAQDVMSSVELYLDGFVTLCNDK